VVEALAAGLNVMVPWQQDLDEFAAAFRQDLLEEAGGTG
jgi:hypothetical protein